MQGIRPQGLSNEELLRYIYVMGFDKVPAEWVKELVERMSTLLDDNK